MYSTQLPHLCLVFHKKDIGYQCRPRSDTLNAASDQGLDICIKYIKPYRNVIIQNITNMKTEHEPGPKMRWMSLLDINRLTFDIVC